ncbi:MAG TPA: TIR domain-containing protein [Blastocatellia bacterium]|nr:TIR domain-containing protein [Blastocatellia bacterium]
MSEDGRANKIEVFVSLADGDKRIHHNREAWKRLADCMDALRNEGVIRNWFFRAIDAGAPDAAVIEQLKRSDIIIFALGQNYLDHPERYREVLKNLPESGRYLVFSLLLYPGEWYDSPFRRFNLLPSNKEPVTESNDINEAFIEIKEAIKQARLAIYPETSKPRSVKVDWAQPQRSQPSESTGSPYVVEAPPSPDPPEPFDIFEETVEEESSSIIALSPPSMEFPPAPIEWPVAAPASPSRGPRLDSPPEAPQEPPLSVSSSPSRARGFDSPEEAPVEPPIAFTGPASRARGFDSPEEAPVEPPIASAPSPSPPENREPTQENEIRQPGALEGNSSSSTLNRQELEFERNRIVTDAARMDDIQPNREAQKDVVDCTVFAPPSAPRDSLIFVQVFAHLREQANEALRMASEFDSDAERRAVKSLEEFVARGTRLSFELTMPGLRCAEPVQSIVWRGTPDVAQFAVEIPGDGLLGACVGSVIVSAHSVPIGHIKFKLQVVQAGSEAPAPEAVGEEAKRYKLAFISYASADRSKVLARVQMLNLVGIRYFQDVLSLKPGDKWETEIYRNIDSCDLFLLFWSKAARDSEWVMNEVRYAMNRPQPPEIRPVVLEGPPLITPPEDLNDLHFNDGLVYFILDQRN